jgi:hypothetical protein
MPGFQTVQDRYQAGRNARLLKGENVMKKNTVEASELKNSPPLKVGRNI